ncbi:MAG: DUF2752 domain-containing protein [Bacilli bacterium]|nr:DUF2752 domain-containing protein [Bacilli bacterium]
MKKRILKVLVISLLIVLLLFLYPVLLGIIHFKCPFRLLFDIYCAGCGATRMIKSILKLDMYQAFRYNPLMFILSIFILVYAIYFIYNYIKNGTLKLPPLKIIIIIIIVLILYMVLRNISYFYYLRPTQV